MSEPEWSKYISLTRHSNHSPIIVRCDLIEDIEALNKGLSMLTYDGQKIEVTESPKVISKKIGSAVPVSKLRTR